MRFSGPSGTHKWVFWSCKDFFMIWKCVFPRSKLYGVYKGIPLWVLSDFHGQKIQKKSAFFHAKSPNFKSFQCFSIIFDFWKALCLYFRWKSSRASPESLGRCYKHSPKKILKKCNLQQNRAPVSWAVTTVTNDLSRQPT